MAPATERLASVCAVLVGQAQTVKSIVQASRPVAERKEVSVLNSTWLQLQRQGLGG